MLKAAGYIESLRRIRWQKLRLKKGGRDPKHCKRSAKQSQSKKNKTFAQGGEMITSEITASST